MDFKQAFLFLREERDPTQKLVVLTVLAAASAILMPALFAGLIPLAVLLGYTTELLQKVRKAKPTDTRPYEKKRLLPEVKDLSELLMRGGTVLPALLLYNLPFMLFGLCLLSVSGLFANAAAQSLVTIISLSCVGLLSLLYIGVAWPMLAVGLARYADGEPGRVFLQISRLFETSHEIRVYSVQYTLAVLSVNFLSVFVSVILPCIGWVLVAALTFPVHGHLLGQYARRIDEHHQRKLARVTASKKS